MGFHPRACWVGSSLGAGGPGSAKYGSAEGRGKSSLARSGVTGSPLSGCWGGTDAEAPFEDPVESAIVRPQIQVARRNPSRSEGDPGESPSGAPRIHDSVRKRAAPVLELSRRSAARP